MQFGNAKKWMRNDQQMPFYFQRVPILENSSDVGKVLTFSSPYENLVIKKRVARGKLFSAPRCLFNALEEAINERLSSYQINGKLFSLLLQSSSLGAPSTYGSILEKSKPTQGLRLDRYFHAKRKSRIQLLSQ